MLRTVACEIARRAQDAAQVALDQGHLGAGHRHIGAGAHGDADVGAASAGASLMPSPAIATLAGPRLEARDQRGLVCGRTSPWTSSMPSARATAWRW
jgi:hypothetical protein